MPRRSAIAESSDSRGSRLPFSMRESWLAETPTASPSSPRVRPATVRKWRIRWPSVVRSGMNARYDKNAENFDPESPGGAQNMRHGGINRDNSGGHHGSVAHRRRPRPLDRKSVV